MSDTNLVIVRHGESAAQVGGILSGHTTCTGLSDLGRRQVGALRDRLVRTDELGAVHGVYTSILARAIETAEIIRPALGEVIANADCDWCEIHAGEAEGLTYEEMREKYPLVPDTGASEPFVPRFPGGESWAQCFARVGRQLRSLAYQHPGERVVVVGHGGTVGASFVALGGADRRRHRHDARRGQLVADRVASCARQMVARALQRRRAPLRALARSVRHASLASAIST